MALELTDGETYAKAAVWGLLAGIVASVAMWIMTRFVDIDWHGWDAPIPVIVGVVAFPGLVFAVDVWDWLTE